MGRIKPIWSLILILAGGIGLFLIVQLHSWDAFIYRPGSEYSDLTVTFWPNIHYIQQSLREYGELPLWRTLIFSGSPFDVDPQSGLWYPPNLIFLLLPATVGFNILFFLHLVLAGLGMWVWSQAEGISTGGGVLAALAYAFTPKIFAHLGFGHVGLVYGAAYIPWVIWAGLRIGQGSWRNAGAFALALGLQIITSPQLALYTGLVTGGYWFVIGVRGCRVTGKTNNLSFPVVGMVLGGVLALCVSAVQLLPMLRFAPLSDRSGLGVTETAVSSLPFRYLWGLVLADHGGFSDYILYVGIPVLGLALLAFKQPRTGFWWAFIVTAMIFSLGNNTPMYAIVFKLLPLLAWLRAPSRIVFMVTAAFALLAGFGFDRLAQGLVGQHLKSLKRFAVGLGSLALMLVIGYSLVVRRPPDNLLALGIVVSITAALFVVIASGKVPPKFAVASVAILILADLWIVDATLIEGRSEEEVFIENGLGAFLASQMDGEPFRVYSPSYSLPRQVAALHGIETADGVDPLYLKAYDQFMRLASGVPRQSYGVTVPPMEGEGDIQLVNRGFVPRPDLLGLLNVKYVAAEFPLDVDGLQEIARFNSTYLYENELYWPRVFVVGQKIAVNNIEDALVWFENGDVLQTAVVENERLLGDDLDASIHGIEYTANHLEFEVSMEQSGMIVLSQTWYPGWQVWINGEPGILHSVDGVLTGLDLEAGTHLVELKYSPVTLFYGLGLSAFGIAVSLFLLLGLRPGQEANSISGQLGEK